MSHYSRKILEEALENGDFDYFPSDLDLRELDDIIRLAAYFEKNYKEATPGKILELLKENCESTELQQALLFLYLNNESQAEALLLSQKEGFDYFDNILSYLKHSDFISEFYNILISNTKDSYMKLRIHDDLFYKEYAKKSLLQTVKTLDEREKLSMIKEMARVEVIKGKALDESTIQVEDLLVDVLLEELDCIIINKSNKLISVMTIENAPEQDVVLKDKDLKWGLENKTLRKLNDWITRAKDVILTTSLNVMSSPKTKKLAVGALVLGVALGSTEAMADMTDAAQNLTDLGDTLAEKIGNVEGIGDCNIGTEIYNKDAHNVQARLNLGDYVIDVKGFGYDAGASKSSEVAVKIGRLKAESSCTLDLEDAKRMAKLVEKIVKNQ